MRTPPRATRCGPGKSFAARVAGSQLMAVGLPELIMPSLAQYEAKALELATNPPALAALRARLVHMRPTAALFDTVCFTRNLETAYEEMWRLWREGRKPRAIDVAALSQD